MENVMVIAVITPDEAMKELDRDLEKTCEIMGLLYHNYGIELSDNEFDKIFDIVNTPFVGLFSHYSRPGGKKQHLS